jgi:hypothetical protein
MEGVGVEEGTRWTYGFVVTGGVGNIAGRSAATRPALFPSEEQKL